MSTGTASPTGSPSVDAVHDFISDTWPTLTHGEALIRLTQLLENMTRVRDAGATPAPLDQTGPGTVLHGIGADSGPGNSTAKNHTDFATKDEGNGFFSDEESEDIQIEKWLSKKQKVIFGYTGIKLSGDRFQSWKDDIHSVLNVNRLPAIVLKDKPNSNPTSMKFKKWKACNEVVRTFLKRNLSDDLSVELSVFNTAREIWLNLIYTFENTALEFWSAIMNEWNLHKQGQTQKVDEYIREQKDFNR